MTIKKNCVKYFRGNILDKLKLILFNIENNLVLRAHLKINPSKTKFVPLVFIRISDGSLKSDMVL